MAARIVSVWVLALIPSAAALAQPKAVAQPKAKDVEQRHFVIFVDGKEAGQSNMTITVQDDGATVMSGNVKVEFRHLLIQYTLQADASETWKDGKLVGLRSTTVERGKKIEVTATPDKNQLRVKINGQEKQVRPDVWTTSYWKLADARFHNKGVPLFDPEKGKEMTGELRYVATEPITVGKDQHNCYHFRVTGVPVPIELWFDRYHRLVRQEFTEEGHKVIVQLQQVKR